MTKICKVCGEIKPLDQFNKNRTMKDGRLNTCAYCSALLKREYRKANRELVNKQNSENRKKHWEKNKEAIRAMDRKRSKTEISIKRRRDYIKRMKTENPLAYKNMRKEANQKHKNKYAEKFMARKILNCAIRNGGLVAPCKCEICGQNKKVEAHHPDYSKPLDVQWLCDSCHKKVHVEIREKERKLKFA